MGHQDLATETIERELLDGEADIARIRGKQMCR